MFYKITLKFAVWGSQDRGKDKGLTVSFLCSSELLTSFTLSFTTLFIIWYLSWEIFHDYQIYTEYLCVLGYKDLEDDQDSVPMAELFLSGGMIEI